MFDSLSEDIQSKRTEFVGLTFWAVTFWTELERTLNDRESPRARVECSYRQRSPVAEL
jgi:hypothetical protein